MLTFSRFSGRGDEEEQIIFEETTGRKKHKRRAKSRAGSVIRDDESVHSKALSRRGRSVSPARSSRALGPPIDDYDLSGEAEFYNRKALERATIGEGYNGATRDWGRSIDAES